MILADPEKSMADWLATMKEKEVINPYADMSRDDLTDLYLEVERGTSQLSPKNRQFIVDEVNRRAER